MNPHAASIYRHPPASILTSRLPLSPSINSHAATSHLRRTGASLGGMRIPEEGFSRNAIYSQNAYPGEMLGRDIYPHAPVSGMWPQSRRRNFDDEYSLIRDSRRHAAPLHDMDNYRDLEGYHDIDKFHDSPHHL